MNKDQIEGKGKQIEGRIKTAIGKAVGNDRLQVKGKLATAAGKVQSAVGDVRENVKDRI